MVFGLTHLASHDLLHYDIKPENILVKNGVFKLSDFGFALNYRTMPKSDILVGTLAFIAP